MTPCEVERSMTKLAVGALFALILLPLAAPLAEAAPTSFTINVVSARSLGCSPDFWTSPDLRVRVFVNDVAVLTTREGSDQDEPTFGAVVVTSAQLPAAIAVEVEEGEPTGFFGTGTTYVPCAVGAGGATRASFTYNGEPVMGRTLRGDGEKAAEVVLVVGTSAPPAPAPTAAVTATSVALTWANDPTGQATAHRLAYGGAGRVIQATAATSVTITGLCDNQVYVYRILRDASPWHVTSADVTAKTTNVAPAQPAMLAAQRDGNVTFESRTTHDIARFEIHASSSTEFAPSQSTLRTTHNAGFVASGHVELTGVAFQANDFYALVRAVDSGGLQADSPSIGIGAPARSGSSNLVDDCSGEPTYSAPPIQATQPSPTQPATEPTQPTPEPTPVFPTQEPQPVEGNFTVVSNPADGPGIVDGHYDSYLSASAAFEIKVKTRAGLTLNMSEPGLVSDLVDVPRGGNVTLTVLLINKGLLPLVVRANQTMSLRNDSDIGTFAKASGFAAAYSATRVALEPYSKEETTITLMAPANATLGEVVMFLQFMSLMDETETHVYGENAFGFTVPGRVVAAQSAAATVDAGGASLGVSAKAAMWFAGLGGGAAAIGVGAFVLRRDATRFALAVALYTRLAKSEVLDHPGREQLQQRIAAQPGITYSDLRRASGMNTGAIVHHLRAMERAGVVASRKEGAYRRFYPLGEAPRATEFTVSPLTPMQARVLEVLQGEALTQNQLAEKLQLSQQGTSHHVKALERAGHIESFYDGRVWRYRPVLQTGAVRP